MLIQSFRLLSIFTLIGLVASAQKKVIFLQPETYQQLKKENKLDPGITYLPANASTKQHIQNEQPVHPSQQEIAKSASVNASNCSCMLPLDGTFSKADFSLGISPGSPPDYRCDDAYTPAKTLPFTFCFYGSDYDSCFINSNGNVSFVRGNSSYNAGGFPAGNVTNPDTIMIAPFWGDVDTRDAGSGLVYYKITSTYMIVKWENVGYYNLHSDKKNTFQLIISDGLDPIIPNGNNIAFCYGDMQWATGDSGTVISNGFGGTPATVGVNRGDGIKFIQMGRFDQAGSAYDGPYGNSDGVDWLDNQSFYFNACNSTNFPPIATNFGGCGDTIKLCALGDTVIVGEVFLAPENNQSLTLSATSPTLGNNLSVITNSTQNGSGTIAIQIIGSVSLTGFHNLSLTATDNGTPVQTTTINMVVQVTNIPTPNPILTVNPQPACANTPVTVTLTNCSQFDGTWWSTNASGCSIPVSTSDTFYVTVNKNGCYKTAFAPVVIFPNPAPVINGNLQYCKGTPGTSLNVPPPSSGAAYQTYNWDGGASATHSLNPALAGNHTVTVTDANGCSGSATVTVAQVAPLASIASPSPICPGHQATLIASATPSAGISYSWLPGGSTGNTLTTGTPGTYSVIATDASNCQDTAAVILTGLPQPTAQVTFSPNAEIAPGTSVNFTDMSTITAPATISSWHWTYGDGTGTSSALQNPVYAYANGGTFPVTLIVTGSSGCADTIVQRLEITYPISFPNIITTNNDNINEYLEFHNLTYYKNNILLVYDRWGKRVFESSDYKNEWKPAELSDGTYYYIIEIPDKHIKQDGFFQLLKH